MRIEVYLRHISQELTGGNIGREGRLVRVQDASCVDGYQKNCGCNMVAMPWLERDPCPLRRSFLREESFGGLLYDTTSGVVFRLDKEAFAVVQRLRREDDLDALMGATVLDASRQLAKRYEADPQAMRELLDELRILGLW